MRVKNMGRKTFSEICEFADLPGFKRCLSCGQIITPHLMALCLLSMLTLLLSGCATMTSGGTQQMSFQTVPDDVVVTLTRNIPAPPDHYDTRAARSTAPKPMKQETRILGKTPFTLQLDRADGLSVTFSKDGYTSVTMPLTTETNSAVWGNILVGGFFGTTTDITSGAIYEYVPNQYVVTLNPVQAGLLDRSTGRSDRDQARLFMLHSYTDLMSDLSRGGGEILSAVLSLLHVAPHDDADAQRTLAILAQRHPDSASFVASVTEYYFSD